MSSRSINEIRNFDGEPPKTRTSKFSVTLASAIPDLETGLKDRLGADDWRLSTATPHRKRDGRPYADANPDDPGAVVRWSMDGEQYCVAADEYTDLRDNVRAIGLYITEKRKIGDRPIHTGQNEFATARSPSGEDEDTIVVAGNGRAKEPHEVLGVAPDAPEAVVRGAYRELLKERHPDHDGAAALRELQNAKQAILDS